VADLEILLWARAIERILTVLFSGVSLVLGWNLFKVGIVQDQQAEFANKSFTVKLQKVGPGVFFALFSIVGFVYALSRPLDLKDLPPSAPRPEGSATVKGTSVSYEYKRTNPAEDKEFLAINTITELAIPKALLTGTDREKGAIQDASTILQNTRRGLLLDRYGSAFVKYEQLKNDLVKNPSLLDNTKGDERNTFYEIDRLMTDSLLSSK
jgi:hypothetical protein